MSQMKITKKMRNQAQSDAERWAEAEMFYGEGAGTRRKLLNAELQTKFHEHPEYEPLFMDAYNKLDMNWFAKNAIKERKRLDRAAKAGKNIRALKSGNLNNLTTGVFIVAGAVYVARQTGYDKVIEAKAKELYKKAKAEVKYRKMRAQGLNVEKIV